jgi:large subunit ribosomal protein L18Ae
MDGGRLAMADGDNATIQILRVAEIEKKEDVKRPYIRQLLEPGLKFPLPHRREFILPTWPNRSCRSAFSTNLRPLRWLSFLHHVGTKSKAWYAANRPATWA